MSKMEKDKKDKNAKPISNEKYKPTHHNHRLITLTRTRKQSFIKKPRTKNVKNGK